MSNKNKSAFFDKKYLTRVLAYTTVSLFVIGVIFYLGYHMSGSMKTGIDVMYAKGDTAFETIIAKGYILRDETPIDGSLRGGALSPLVPDGAKIKAGEHVADIYASAKPGTQEKINLINSQIAFYEKCKSSRLSVGDTSAVHKDISGSVLAIRRATAAGKAGDADAVKSALVLDVRKLGVLTGNVSDYNAQIAALQTELAALKSELGASTGSVSAPSAGYYFSSTDGYEELFTSENINAITYSDFMEMVETAEAAPESEEDSVGKIVNDFKWYVACPITSGEASNLTKDRYYDIFLEKNGSSPVEMKLTKVLSNATDAVAIFECTKISEDFDYTRVQDCEIVFKETAGFKIPVSAIRFHDGYEGVYILDEITVKFRRISTIMREGEYYFCYAEDPEEVAETPEEETENAESSEAETEDSEEEGVYYAYLRENDIIIKSGTGLYVGMTYNPKG